jgi:hypothetical protein
MSAHEPPKPSLRAILVVPLVVALVLTLFAWPSARLEPRDLPIGVAGPSAQADALEARLAANEGAFDVHRYADEAQATRAIEDREVYGAWVAGPSGPKLLTASAASPAVAQLLGHAASAEGAGVQVQDVVAGSPRAAALPSSVLPLVIAGVLTGVIASLLASAWLPRIGLVLAVSVLSGLAATAIVQSWLDVVGGDWWRNAAVLSLTILSMAAFVAGLHALLGEKGLILGAVTMIFIGNPFSGVGSAPELLPQPVGALGQLMPPGAGGNLLRSTGYFDGAAAGGHVAVLAAWALVGLIALVAGARSRRSRPSAALVPAA